MSVDWNIFQIQPLWLNYPQFCVIHFRTECRTEQNLSKNLYNCPWFINMFFFSWFLRNAQSFFLRDRDRKQTWSLELCQFELQGNRETTVYKHTNKGTLIGSQKRGDLLFGFSLGGSQNLTKNVSEIVYMMPTLEDKDQQFLIGYVQLLPLNSNLFLADSFEWSSFCANRNQRKDTKRFCKFCANCARIHNYPIWFTRGPLYRLDLPGSATDPAVAASSQQYHVFSRWINRRCVAQISAGMISAEDT